MLILLLVRLKRKEFGVDGWYIAAYFEKCLSAHDLNEMNIEIIRNTLYKTYLEDFYEFCQSLEGPTAQVMGEILQVQYHCNFLFSYLLF